MSVHLQDGTGRTRAIHKTKIHIFNWSVVNAFVKTNTMPIIFVARIHFSCIPMYPLELCCAAPYFESISWTKRPKRCIRKSTSLHSTVRFSILNVNDIFVGTMSTYPHFHTQPGNNKKALNYKIYVMRRAQTQRKLN